MKTLAITDRVGRITGLVRFEEEQDKEAPEARLVPQEGQEVHEIQLPRELDSMTSILEIFEALQSKYALARDPVRLTRNP